MELRKEMLIVTSPAEECPFMIESKMYDHRVEEDNENFLIYCTKSKPRCRGQGSCGLYHLAF